MASVISNAAHTMDHVKDTASAAGESLAGVGGRAMKFLDAARSEEARAVDSVLRRIGLQRRESALGPVLFFAAGAVVAASLVLILAPNARKAMREKIRGLFGAASGRVTVEPGMQDMKSAVQHVDAAAAANSSDESIPTNGAVSRL